MPAPTQADFTSAYPELAAATSTAVARALRVSIAANLQPTWGTQWDTAILSDAAVAVASELGLPVDRYLAALQVAADAAMAEAKAWTDASITHIYVSDVNGSDSYDGKSSTYPLKTLTAAEALTPDSNDKPLIIHVGKHAGAGYAPPSFLSRDMKANLYVIGDGAGQTGEDGFTAITTGSTNIAQTGSSRILVVTSGSLTSEALRGKTIQMTSGLASGERRTIRNNTTTNIVPCWPFSVAPANGDTFRVVEPEVDISFTDNLANGDHLLCDECGGIDRPDGFPGGRGGIWFINQRWRLSIAATTLVHMRSSRLFLLGIEYQEANNFLWDTSGCGVGVGFEVNDQSLTRLVRSPVVDGLSPTNAAWAGWGFASIGTPTTTAPIFQIYDSFWYCLALVMPRFSAFTGAFVKIDGGNIYGLASGGAGPSVQAAGPGSSITFAGDSGTSHTILVSAASSAAAIDVAGFGASVTASRTVIANATGPGVKAANGSFISLTTGCTVTAGTFGAVARFAALIQISTTVTSWTSTPTGNDISVDEIASSGMAITTLAAVGDFLSSMDGAVIQRN